MNRDPFDEAVVEIAKTPVIYSQRQLAKREIAVAQVFAQEFHRSNCLEDSEVIIGIIWNEEFGESYCVLAYEDGYGDKELSIRNWDNEFIASWSMTHRHNEEAVLCEMALMIDSCLPRNYVYTTRAKINRIPKLNLPKL
jgi:hypothetical protein